MCLRTFSFFLILMVSSNSFRCIFITMCSDSNTFNNAFYAWFEVEHDCSCGTMWFSKQLLIIVKRVAFLSPQLLILSALVSSKVGVLATISPTFGAIVRVLHHLLQTIIFQPWKLMSFDVSICWSRNHQA